MLPRSSSNPRDGGPLPLYDAGQHLPIELPIPGQPDLVRRTYTLSGRPSPECYRISVKREKMGLASSFLHDFVEPGTILDTRSPAGDFMLSHGEHPVALISAGIGVTPMVSMLHALTSEDAERPVWFIHGARDGAHHPLANEVRELAASKPGISTHIAYSRPRLEDRPGEHYDSEGRIDGTLLAGLIDDAETQYFLCGPTRFMADIQGSLEERGVPPDHIHTETFGPVG